MIGKVILGVVPVIYSSPAWATYLIYNCGLFLGKKGGGDSGFIYTELGRIPLGSYSVFDHILSGAGTFPWMLLFLKPFYDSPQMIIQHPAQSVQLLASATPYCLVITLCGLVCPFAAAWDFVKWK